MIRAIIERPVDWQDTDAAGHYHHATVIRWVEAAEAVLLDEIGQRWLFGRIPRVRYEVEYLDRMWFGDTASIELSIVEMGRASMRYDFVITRIAGTAGPAAKAVSTIAARGALIVAHAPEPDGGAQPWPGVLTAALRGVHAPEPDADPRSKPTDQIHEE